MNLYVTVTYKNYQRFIQYLLNENHMKSLYIRRFRPGRRFTEKLDQNLTHAGLISAEEPERIGETRYIKNQNK